MSSRASDSALARSRSPSMKTTRTSAIAAGTMRSTAVNRSPRERRFWRRGSDERIDDDARRDDDRPRRPGPAGRLARPRKSTAPIGTRMIQMRLAAPHDRPPAGIRLTNNTASPTIAIVAMRGVSRWLRWNKARAVPNAASWTSARAVKTGRANARSTSPKKTATAMNTNATATAVRFRIRRSGSSAGSAPMSSMRAGFIEGISVCGGAGPATRRARRAGRRPCESPAAWPERGPRRCRSRRLARRERGASPRRGPTP